jgi:X8 domain
VIPRSGYWALSSQLAKVPPSSTDMVQYVPTNTAPPCSKTASIEVFDRAGNVTLTAKIDSTLPSRYSHRLCSCMMETNRCIGNNGADPLGDILQHDNICNEVEQACSGVRENVTFGRYGSYLFCNATERLSWIYSRYLDLTNDSVTCESIGGVPQKPVDPTSQASDCKEFLKQAGGDGTGTITFTPTSTLAIDATNGKYRGEGASKGVKVGIGIGASVFAIFASIAIWYIYLRSRRKRENNSNTDTSNKLELEANSMPKKSTIEIGIREVEELCGDEIVEIGTHQKVHELNPASAPVELDGSSSRRVE